jgi:L-alanine-DL-glutamate epimerase-like enolase superfamily enzyme
VSERPIFSLEFLRLPLRYEWKLSRNTSVEKTNGLVSITFQGYEGRGEIAPNIRYEESPERVKQEFDSSVDELVQAFSNERSWKDTLDSLPLCQALKTGLDMAYCNLFAKREGKSLAAFFGLPEAGSREICYTIPVMEVSRIGGFIKEQELHRFPWLKLKVNAETATEMLNETLLHFPGKIAIDGNEAWKNPEEVIHFLDSISESRIMFLEQPFPASMRDAYPVLKERSRIEIWGDESILGQAEPDYWKRSFSGINVKLMKAGSLSNSIAMLKSAKEAGLKTMLGCMVETSLGISAAMQLESLADFMDLDGFLLLEKEPFHLVRESQGRVSLTT